MKTNLVVDTSNILFRVAAMNAKQYFSSDAERAGLALHVAFQSINKYYKRFRPDRLIFTFEGRNNWRKTYTNDELCIRKQPYKGNRPKDNSMIPFFELIASFREVMEVHSAAYCISEDHCEADDIIAGIIQLRDNPELIDMPFIIEPDEEIIVLSGDKDFIQLLQHDNVRLIDPQTGDDKINAKSVKEYEDNIGFYLFEKYIRGDKGDNVFSAYPNVRKKRIQAAYDDDFTRLEFMNEEWQIEDEDGKVIEKYRVGDLVEENKMLVDLEKQPLCVRNKMLNEICNALNEPQSYNNFHFMRFLGTYKLVNIIENIHLYIDMLSGNHVTKVKPNNQSGVDTVNTVDIDDSKSIIEDRRKTTMPSEDDVLEF